MKYRSLPPEPSGVGTPEQENARKNVEKFTNEYGMGEPPVGLDDYWAFVDIKRKEYLSVKRRDYFKDIDEANVVLKKITGAWDNRILPKYGAKSNSMKTEDKIKLFERYQGFLIISIDRTKSKNLYQKKSYQ
jgi:hypothetical protein